MSDRTPTPIEVPVAVTSGGGGGDSGGLWVKLSLAGTIGVLVTVISFYYRTEAHSSNHVVHVDEVGVIAGGGLAYKNDVASVRHDVKDEARRTRAAVRKMTLDCKKHGDGFACRVDLPENPD